MKLVTWWKTRVWWVRWMTCSIAIIACFYAVEDTRGHLALERAKAEYLDSGLRLNVDDIRGPEIPDEENFAASEIVREAYADPERAGGRLLPNGRLPDPPSDITEIEYYGFRGQRGNYPDREAREKYEQLCQEMLVAIAPQLRRYLDAAMRPSCDLRAVTDPTDFEAPANHFGLLLDAGRVLKLYQVSPEPENGFPISKTEMILGNLAATNHLKTNSTLINQLIASASGEMTLRSIAEGILRAEFDLNALDAIGDRLARLRPKRKRDFIEFETAVGFSRYGSHREARRIYLKQLEFGIGAEPIVVLPKLPFHADLTAIEDFLNRMVVAIIPRGWIWQGNALQLRTMLGTPPPDPNPFYTLLSFDGEDILATMVEREDKFQASIELAILAIEIEKHRLKTGDIPAEKEFDTGSPNIGYGIEANGQPLLWYSESTPIGKMPAGKALKSYDEKHLWRYPPPEK